MTYKCPKGHDSTDSDYCSECGALIGQSKISAIAPEEGLDINKMVPSTNESSSGEACPDCGTPRVGGARFCEVCRHDFQNNKTGVAEAMVASQAAGQPQSEPSQSEQSKSEPSLAQGATTQTDSTQQDKADIKAAPENEYVIPQKLNIVISVDKAKAAASDIETAIKPDAMDRIFPLDLDENLVGRRSASKGVYPEIEINDPGVSHRHLKFLKQQDGSFAVLDLGSANGTEVNGKPLEPGINVSVKAGDELSIGIWTMLRIVER